MSDEQAEAMQIEAKAWKLIDAFDTAALAMGGGDSLDRRIPYAALIMMVTSFIRSSTSPPDLVLSDFYNRVVAGVSAPRPEPS